MKHILRCAACGHVNWQHAPRAKQIMEVLWKRGEATTVQIAKATRMTHDQAGCHIRVLRQYGHIRVVRQVLVDRKWCGVYAAITARPTAHEEELYSEARQRVALRGLGGYGRVIRDARRRAGLTVAQLSRLTGINPSTISGYERGIVAQPLRQQTATVIGIFCRALNLTPADLDIAIKPGTTQP